MPLPGLAPARRRLIELVSLAQPTRLLAGGGQTSSFAMLEKISDCILSMWERRRSTL